MRRLPVVVWLALGAMGVVSPVIAQEGAPQAIEATSTERVKFPAGGTIRVEGSYGYLSVDGWDEPQVEITITKTTDRFFKPGEEEDAKRRLTRIQVVTERRSETELSIQTTRPSRRGRWLLPVLPKSKAGVTVEYQIHMPRTAHLIVRNDTGYLWISDIAGPIDARSHTGDMIVMLPSAGSSAIDAKSRVGGISSDFAGHAGSPLVVGRSFVHSGGNSSQRIYLRMGRGNITIKQIPPP